jgi:hypothetical protein
MRARACVLVLIVSGCHPTGPEATLDAFERAIRAGRLDQAYALMSAEYRRTHDPVAFEHAVRAGEPRAGEKLRAGKVTLEAEADLGDGDTLSLVWEHGGWRLARDPLDFYPQSSPAEALRSFIRAVENRRYDVVLKFVPQRYRTQITVEKLRDRWEGERRGELLEQLKAARAHLGEPFAFASSGDEASLPIAGGEPRKQVRLVREEGAWKVESIE